MIVMLGFYTRKPRSFSHKPIYWDAKKEEMERSKKKIESGKLSVNDDMEQRKEQLRGKFIQNSTYLNKRRKTAVSSFSFVKILSLIVLLLFLFYMSMRYFA